MVAMAERRLCLGQIRWSAVAAVYEQVGEGVLGRRCTWGDSEVAGTMSGYGHMICTAVAILLVVMLWSQKLAYVKYFGLTGDLYEALLGAREEKGGRS